MFSLLFLVISKCKQNSSSKSSIIVQVGKVGSVTILMRSYILLLSEHEERDGQLELDLFLDGLDAPGAPSGPFPIDRVFLALHRER